MRVLAVLLFCFSLAGTVHAQEPAKGWLGVELKDLTKEEADALGFDGPHGAKVVKPAPGGPAEKAGLLPDDVLLSVDGSEVDNVAATVAAISGKAPTAEVKLRLLRGGKEKRLAVTLGARPGEQARAEPKDAPILQLDTGGHMANIEAAVFTPDGKFLVSAGDDKLIRIWDWRTGKTVRTIRGEVAQGDAGEIRAMALSPDGKWLAAGGFLDQRKGHPDRYAIRLYDFASGRMVSLLKGHEKGVLGLAFSPDGGKLISGSGHNTAIIWDVKSGHALRRLLGHRERVNAVAFSRDGSRVATASADATLRLWSEDGTFISVLKGHTHVVGGVAFSPVDDVIVSASWDETLKFWDINGRLVRSAKIGCSSHFSYDPTGRFIVCDSGEVVEASSGKVRLKHQKGPGVVFSAISPDSRWAATGRDNKSGTIYVWDVDGGHDEKVLGGSSQSVLALGFSDNGCRLAWGYSPKHGEVKFGDENDLGDLEHEIALPCSGMTLGTPQRLGGPVTKYTKPVTKISSKELLLGSSVTGEYAQANMNLLKIKQGSTVIATLNAAEHGSRHQAFTFTPDGKSVLSGGSNGAFTAYDIATKEPREFIGHVGNVWAVGVTTDGRIAASTATDGIINLWNASTHELIVSFFYGTDGEWVMWTPQGYYAGSPGADKIVGWQINRGPENAADYVTAEQLRKHLNRPDIVAKAIQLASAEEAVRTSNGTQFKLSDLLARPAPRLRILFPAPGTTVNASGTVALKLTLHATPDPVTRIRIQVNGRQLDDFLPESGPKFEAGEHSFPVPLAKGKNTIVVTALNEIGWSKVQDGTLSLTSESAGGLDKRGTLYILAIGVSKYPGVPHNCAPKPTCDLNFTGNDAIAFADIMEQRLGALHEKVVRRVLVNEGKSDASPTAANIIDALGILSAAQPNDTVAVFLAGHGLNDGPNYRFVPTDAAISNGALRASSVVPWYAIEEAIDGAKGRRLLFIDTCHSAGAYNQRLGNAAYYANILAYSSARWDQEALESPTFQHGLFTQALVDGLGGAADLSKAGRVDTAQLSDYLQKRVPELAKPFLHEQNPQVFKGRDAEDYTLAVLK